MIELQDLIFDFDDEIEEGGPPVTSTQTQPPLTVEDLQNALRDFPPRRRHRKNILARPTIFILSRSCSSSDEEMEESNSRPAPATPAQPAPDLHKGDPMVPVYGTFSSSLPTKSVVELIASEIDDTLRAKLVPSRPTENYAFMVDTSFLSNWKDVLPAEEDFRDFV